MSFDPIYRAAVRGALLLTLTLVVVFVNDLTVTAMIPMLPPRPTPAVTPSPTPAPRPPARSRTAPAAEPLSHIVLMTEPAADGLWTVVQWQGRDGAWHDVAGWQGTMAAGSKRWAVLGRNFGEGPFRWVVYRAPGGNVCGMSPTFTLPAVSGERLLVRVVLAC